MYACKISFHAYMHVAINRWMHAHNEHVNERQTDISRSDIHVHIDECDDAA